MINKSLIKSWVLFWIFAWALFVHSLVILNHFINEKFQAEEVEGNTSVRYGVVMCGVVCWGEVWCG